MLKSVSCAAILILALKAQAQGPTIYLGEQPVGVAGDVMPCYVEVSFADAGARAIIRAIMTDPHEGEEEVFGPQTTLYDAENGGYGFSSTDATADTREVFLAAATPESAQGLWWSEQHENHVDVLSCESLRLATGQDLIDAQEKFDADQDQDQDHDHERP